MTRMITPENKPSGYGHPGKSRSDAMNLSISIRKNTVEEEVSAAISDLAPSIQERLREDVCFR